MCCVLTVAAKKLRSSEVGQDLLQTMTNLVINDRSPVHLLIATLTFSKFLFCINSVSGELTESKNVTTLNILALAPYPSNEAQSRPRWAGAPALIPAVQLAAGLINDDASILTGYQLKVIPVDSGCNLISTLSVSFVQTMFYLQNVSESPVIGIVGPACSAATRALAPLILQDRLNLVQISTATTPEIDGSKLYDNTFRIVSAVKFIKAFESLLKFTKWTRYAVFYDDHSRYHIDLKNKFQDNFGRMSDILYSSGVEDNQISGAFKTLQNMRLRVFFVFASQASARKVLCVAHNQSMLFPTYQWIFADRSKNEFVTDTTVNIVTAEGLNHVNCTKFEMEKALNGVMLTEFQYKRVDNVKTISHTNLSENTKYEELLMQHLQERNLNLSEDVNTARLYADPYFDATWALALAVNKSLIELEEKNLTIASSYNHGNRMVGDVILKHIRTISFEGIGGKITYDDQSRSILPSTGVHMRQLNITKGSSFNTSPFFSYINASDEVPPQAMVKIVEDTFKPDIVKPHLSLGLIILIVAVVSFIAVASLHFLFIYHSDKKSIKATSPYLSSLIFSGSYISLVAVFLFTVRETFVDHIYQKPVHFGVLCSTIIWCSTLSMTLIFGTLCVKTWRIYRIFGFFRQGRVRYVSDGHLIFFIILLLLIDTVFLLVWDLQNPWQISVMNSTSGDSLILHYTCKCDYLLYWFVPLGAYKGVLVAIVVYLAFLIRHIKRKEFDFTKYIVSLIYLLLLLFAIFLPISILFAESVPLISFISQNILALATVFASCAFLFVPPLRLAWTKKETSTD